MQDFIEQVVTYIRELPSFVKLLVLIVSVMIEYIFPLFPGDTIVLFAGFLNAHEALDLWQISVAVLVGTLIGSSIAYGLGRLIYEYQDQWHRLSQLAKSESYRKFGEWYRKWGVWFLLFNRFFPGIRALFFFVAGAEKITFGKVLLFGGLSAILYSACLFVLGYTLGFKVEVIIRYFYQFNAIALGALFFVIVSVFVFLWRAARK